MNSTVISVRNLGKRYKLGTTVSADTLRDHIMNAVTGVLKHGNDSKNKKNKEDFWALKDVSFDVQEGEVLGVIGPNGAGKSTLLKILTGITEPTEGEVRIRGRVASLLEVGTGFHPELSGRENIFMNGVILGMTQREIKAKFDEIVDFSGIEKFLDTPVKRYSSGMRVRLGFAVAAHLEPELLLIDEVLAVGDAEFQSKCLGKMDDIGQSGRTVLFVSHNMSAIQSLCPRCLLLDSGNIKKFGPTTNIINQYIGGTETRGEFDFSDICDRKGTGKVRITYLRMYSNNNNSVFMTGDDLYIEIHYSGNEDIHHPNFLITISTSTGQLVSHLSASRTGFRPQKVPKKGQVVCILKNPNLLPGRYLLNFALDINKGTEICDWLKNCAWFDIVSIKGIPHNEMPQKGVCFFKTEWEVIPDEKY